MQRFLKSRPVRTVWRRAAALVRFTRGGKLLAGCLALAAIAAVAWLGLWLLRPEHRHGAQEASAGAPSEFERAGEADGLPPSLNATDAAAANETEPVALPPEELPPDPFEAYRPDPPWPRSNVQPAELQAAGAARIVVGERGAEGDPLPALLRRANTAGLPCLAVSVPTTSRATSYPSAEGTPLFTALLPSLLETAFGGDPAHRTFLLLLLGFDAGDPLFDSAAAVSRMASAARDAIGSRPAAVQVYRLEGLPPGHVAAAHNALLARGYAAGCPLLAPLEDDLRFLSPGWLPAAAAALRENPMQGGYGAVGLNESHTDEVGEGRFHVALVPRSHFEALGYAFDASLPNAAHRAFLSRLYEASASSFFLPDAPVEDLSRGPAPPHPRRYAPVPGLEWVEDDVVDFAARRLAAWLEERGVPPYDIAPAQGDTWLDRHASPERRRRLEAQRRAEEEKRRGEEDRRRAEEERRRQEEEAREHKKLADRAREEAAAKLLARDAEAKAEAQQEQEKAAHDGEAGAPKQEGAAAHEAAASKEQHPRKHRRAHPPPGS
eukprot:tig00000640_g2779.t1